MRKRVVTEDAEEGKEPEDVEFWVIEAGNGTLGSACNRLIPPGCDCGQVRSCPISLIAVPLMVSAAFGKRKYAFCGRGREFCPGLQTFSEHDASKSVATLAFKNWPDEL